VLLHERHVLAEDAFAEIVVWRVPQPVLGSRHRLNYRLALIVAGGCVPRYDNRSRKGRSPAFRRDRSAVRVQQFCEADFRFLGGCRSVETEAQMKAVTLEVASVADVKRRPRAAVTGSRQGARISFGSPELLWQVLTAKRRERLKAMAGQGAMTIREARVASIGT
jgi:hypothetical protein